MLERRPAPCRLPLVYWSANFPMVSTDVQFQQGAPISDEWIFIVDECRRNSVYAYEFLALATKLPDRRLRMEEIAVRGQSSEQRKRDEQRSASDGVMANVRLK